MHINTRFRLTLRRSGISACFRAFETDTPMAAPCKHFLVVVAVGLIVFTVLQEAHAQWVWKLAHNHSYSCDSTQAIPTPPQKAYCIVDVRLRHFYCKIIRGRSTRYRIEQALNHDHGDTKIMTGLYWIQDWCDHTVTLAIHKITCILTCG